MLKEHQGVSVRIIRVSIGRSGASHLKLRGVSKALILLYWRLKTFRVSWGDKSDWHFKCWFQCEKRDQGRAHWNSPLTTLSRMSLGMVERKGRICDICCRWSWRTVKITDEDCEKKKRAKDDSSFEVLSNWVKCWLSFRMISGDSGKSQCAAHLKGLLLFNSAEDYFLYNIE